MKHFYPQTQFAKIKKTISSLCLFGLTTLSLITSDIASAQQVYTLGAGTMSTEELGVAPFAMINRNTKSQYIYFGPEFQDSGADAGFITHFAINITELATPATLMPENVTIKMKQTTDGVFGPTLATGLTTVYNTPVETINTLGWHTIELDTPFLWDGNSHIIVEICRSNADFGTSFKVEAEQYGLGDYRTVGLYSNDTSVAGCNLTGTSPMANGARRTRPNAQFTIEQICDGLPSGGQAVVGAGPYCDGAPFTLSVTNSPTNITGLSLQWQWSATPSGPWFSISGATSPTLSTTQTTAYYYRRQTKCDNTNEIANSTAVFVNGAGCYCAAPTTTNNQVGITSVSFSTINSTSPSNVSYSFFDTNAEVEQTLTYTLSVNVNTNGGTNYTKAWIDWNSNGTYEESESYSLGTVTGGSNVNSGTTATIVVPANAVIGATNLRVRTQQSPSNTDADPCGNIAAGETEDYSLIIEEHLGLGNIGASNSDLLVYANQNGLNIKMKNALINTIEVFDISGRLLAKKSELSNSEITLPEFQGNHNVLIVRVTSDNGVVSSKKVVL